MNIAATSTAGAIIAVGGIAVRDFSHPSLEPYRCLIQRESGAGPVRARFLGTSSILFEDGQTAVLADGFVSRPGGPLRVFVARIAPDTARILALLDTVRPVRLGAVFTGHSHYDHALDAAEIASRSGALLLGSKATVARAGELGVPETRRRAIQSGVPVQVGAFRLTFYAAKHGPPDHAPGVASVAVHPPARWNAWKTDATWSVFIDHGPNTILVHGSAGFVAGSLPARHADVVYLGIAGLGEQTAAEADSLWNEVVKRTGAKRVILIHWDDFWRSVDSPLVALPYLAGSVPKAIEQVRRLAQDSVKILLPTAWTVTDPFADPPGASCETTRPK